MKIPQAQFELLHTICQQIYDKRGFNILTIDVRGVSTMTDYFIFCEGTVDKHVQALFWVVHDRIREKYGSRPMHTEGQSVGDWAALDYGDVIIHFFTPELREKYQLEQIWKAGRVVDTKLEMVVANQL